MGALEQIEAEPNRTYGPDVSASPSTGVVDQDPSSLASQAGLGLDEYALARMVASEEGSSPAPYLLAVAECARNRAAKLGWSISKMLLAGKRSAGKFGQTGTGKWASTARPATSRSLAAARAAIAGSDFAKGSLDFVSPAGMIPGRREGIGEVRKTAQEYIDDRYREGKVWVGDLPGIDPVKLMCFARKDTIKNPEKNVSRSENYVNLASITAFLILVGAVLSAFVIGGVKLGSV